MRKKRGGWAGNSKKATTFIKKVRKRAIAIKKKGGIMVNREIIGRERDRGYRESRETPATAKTSDLGKKKDCLNVTRLGEGKVGRCAQLQAAINPCERNTRLKESRERAAKNLQKLDK